MINNSIVNDYYYKLQFTYSDYFEDVLEGVLIQAIEEALEVLDYNGYYEYHGEALPVSEVFDYIIENCI